MPMDISIVIPIYNSADLIEKALQALIPELERLNLKYEILFADDGSTDNSADVLTSLPQRYKNVNCLFEKTNKGLGTTLRRLFSVAEGKIIIYSDCDLPFGTQIIPRLIEGISQSDIVVASRYPVKNRIAFSRWLTSRLYYLFCKVLFNIAVTDIGSGSVAIRKSALNRLTLQAQRFDIHAEFYIEAVRNNLSILEIPASLSPVSNGKTFSIIKHGLQIICDTIKLKGSLKL